MNGRREAASCHSLKTVSKELRNAASLRPFMDYWNRHDLLAGRGIAVLQDGRTEKGIARGLDDEGRLLLEAPDGVRLVHAGDVHVEWS